MQANSTPFLVASWLNLVLYTAEAALYIVYIVRFPRDRIMHRATVFAAFCSDTVCTVAVCSNAYMLLILPRLINPFTYWAIPTIIISNALSSAIEHIFLTYRIWHLKTFEFSSPQLSRLATPYTRRVCWPSLFLLVLTLTHFCFSTSSAIMTAVNPIANKQLSITSSIVGGALRAVTDILIACILVYQINKFQTSFLTTQTFIRRFTVKVLSTGIVASVIAILIVISLAVNVPACVVLSSIIGRFHSITTLAHLCCRKEFTSHEMLGMPADLETMIESKSAKEDNIDHSGRGSEELRIQTKGSTTPPILLRTQHLPPISLSSLS